MTPMPATWDHAHHMSTRPRVAQTALSGDSGPDFDRRPVGHRVPNLGDRHIADRDASLGPIAIPPRRIERAVIVWQAVDKDRAARLDTHRLRPLPVALVGIGDVERARVTRLHRFIVDAVNPFRRAPVALLLFRA